MKTIIGAVLTLLLCLILFLAIVVGPFAGAYAAYWWDRRPSGTPAPIKVHILFWTHSFALPDSLKAERDEARGITATQSQLISDAAQHDATAKTQIKTIYRTIHDAVPKLITPDTDRKYPLSNGFIRLLDAGAMSSSPGDTRDTDDQPSPFASSVIARGQLDDDQRCYANARQLTDLEQWLRDKGFKVDPSK